MAPVGVEMNKINPVTMMIQSKAGNKAVGSLTEANPMMQAIKNKQTNALMRQSGAVTHDYVLPAVVKAGVPIEMAVAGASGTLLGGPVGGVAAMGATKIFNNQFLPKDNPGTRQKSKLLGEVAGVSGDVGNIAVKQSMKGGKLKKDAKSKKITKKESQKGKQR
jgi:hypothetical protein